MNAKIQKELMAIKGDNELLLAEDVVSWARKHKSSALHGQFEWDQRRAAHAHWLDTARRLIAIHVVYADGQRSLVSLSIDRARPKGGYRDVDDVRNTQSLYEVMLDDALRELKRMEEKYGHIKALAPVWGTAEKVRISRKGKSVEIRETA
jgi:hypothetical protein